MKSQSLPDPFYTAGGTLQDEELSRLHEAGIVSKRQGMDAWCDFVHKRVSWDKAARFLGWYDDNGRLDVARVKEERGRDGGVGAKTGRNLTIADLINLERSSAFHYRPLLDTTQCPHKSFMGRFWGWLSINPAPKLLAGLVLPLAAILSQVYGDELRWFITPPISTLAIVIDGSEAMAMEVAPGVTVWDKAVELAEIKAAAAGRRRSERVAIWIQTGLERGGLSCDAQAQRLTEGYEPAEDIEVAELLKNASYGTGKSSPGPALLKVMAEAPRYSMRGVGHQALILTSASQTCDGQDPIIEICDVILENAFRWASWTNASLSHRIEVINFSGDEVATVSNLCESQGVSVHVTKLDPSRPEESNEELCKQDAELCIPLLPIPTPSDTLETPSFTPISTPEPAKAPSPPADATTLSQPVTPSSTPSPVYQRTATPSKSAHRQPTLPPAATPALLLRAYSGTRAALTEGCNGGRVIGDLGLLDAEPRPQQIEALVPGVPEDLRFLVSDGCVRVASPILGAPSQGFLGYLRAADVCVVQASYAYWVAQPATGEVFAQYRLQRCPD